MKVDKSLGVDAIVLNGPSSAGKTTLARCLQAKTVKTFLHFQLDAFWDMVPPPAEDANSKHFPYMKAVIADTAKSFLKHDMPFILDTVMMPDDEIKLREALAPYNIFYVAVTVDLEVLEAREMLREDRIIGLSRSQVEGGIHKGCDYDLTVDTTNKSPEDLAGIILNNLPES